MLRLFDTHPKQAITIEQSILDILKADPALMAEVIAFIEGSAAKS